MRLIFFRIQVIGLLMLLSNRHATAQISINKDLDKSFEKEKAMVPDYLQDFSEINPFLGVCIFSSIEEDTLNLTEIRFPKNDGVTYSFADQMDEEDLKYQGLNSNVSFVKSALKNDTLHIRVDFPFSSTVIDHTIFNNDAKVDYFERSGMGIYKLNDTDTLAGRINIPVEITKLELSSINFIPNQVIYGYCELYTSPYYVLADPANNIILKIKKRLKYYFSFTIREGKD